MSRGRRLVLALAVYFMGLGLGSSFPDGTMVVGGFSWDWLGGLVTGIGVALLWMATGRSAHQEGGEEPT